MTDLKQLIHRPDGIDGSHYQANAGPMNLGNVKAVMNWLAWKCTQSDKGLDSTYPNVDVQAKALAFRWFLAYHWLSSTTDPVAQAENFLAHAGDWRAGKGAMLDAEEAGITVAKCLACLERIEAETKRPMAVYSGIYVAGGSIWRSPEIRNSAYGPRPMVLAAYITPENLAARLTSLGIAALDIHGWQWWSSYLMPGAITGRVDVDAVITPAIMDVACGISTNPPNPQPQPPVVGGSTMSVLANPVRVYDSRLPNTPYAGAKHGAGDVLHIPMPTRPTGAGGVCVNITVVEPAASGVLVAWGDGAQPGTSNINMHGVNDANFAVVPLTSEGGVNIFTSAATHVIIDLQGWA